MDFQLQISSSGPLPLSAAAGKEALTQGCQGSVALAWGGAEAFQMFHRRAGWVPGERCRSTKGCLFPKSVSSKVKNSEESAGQSGQAPRETSAVTIFCCPHSLQSPGITANTPPLPALTGTHIPPKLPALVPIVTKQKLTGFEKAVNLTATIQKGKENSLGNSVLILEICLQKSASPSGGPSYKSKTSAFSSQRHNSLPLAPPTLSEKEKARVTQNSTLSLQGGSLTLLPKLECSGTISAHCSLCLLGSTGITDTRHYARLISVFLVEVSFHHVGQAGLKLLASSDLPTVASQSAEITGISHHIIKKGKKIINSKIRIFTIFSLCWRKKWQRQGRNWSLLSMVQ
ncbi:hypothetical protein AAY473_009474, partial [Plecturocebus cupreus]